jgi:hypothetical protein
MSNLLNTGLGMFSISGRSGEYTYFQSLTRRFTSKTHFPIEEAATEIEKGDTTHRTPTTTMAAKEAT